MTDQIKKIQSDEATAFNSYQNTITNNTSSVDIAVIDSVHKDNIEKIDIQQLDESNYPPPDQGYSWVILVAGLLNFVISFGSFNAFGVFQTYYLLTVFKDVPADIVSWISTVTIFMTLSTGIFSGPIARVFGIRNSCLIATAIGFFGLILSSLFTEVWHLVITQGIMFGFASSILVNLSLTAQILWFEKHKGLALSIISSGGGIGSIILVPIVTSTVENLDIRWSFRILSIIYLILSGTGSYLLKPRIPYVPSKKIIDFKLLKDPFVLYCSLIGFTMNWGYSTVLLYFPASIEALGKTKSFATYFIMLYAATSIIGRILSGYLADKIGSLKILIFCHTIISISFFTLWYHRYDFAYYVVFYVLFGFFGVNYFSLCPNIVGRHFPIETVTLINAIIFLVNGVSNLICIPILGKVFQAVGKRTNFDAVILIGGSSFIASLGILVAFRYYAVTHYPQYKNGGL
ncbi:hypothetical protein BB561_003546 [Smittium simulii]|uniref:Major facilitator superfamily (MFS) profile domain-containing protein n=1 Tax=Smittium simulii TaxID=133385 RepID=A0A2T9YKN0_9FUNG|nr:hypothetical protein BB561_003546 [Smittium simulii]